MKARRGRIVALLTLEAALVVLWISTPALIELVREQYYLRKLDSQDGSDREVAIEALGKMRSARAVPKLVELMAEPLERTAFSFHPWSPPQRIDPPEWSLPDLLMASTGGEDAWRSPNEIRAGDGFLEVKADSRLLAEVDGVLFRFLGPYGASATVARALRNVGPLGVPELRSILLSKSTSFSRRFIAGIALRNLVHQSPAARRALDEAARSEDAAVRKNAELFVALLDASRKQRP